MNINTNKKRLIAATVIAGTIIAGAGCTDSQWAAYQNHVNVRSHRVYTITEQQAETNNPPVPNITPPTRLDIVMSLVNWTPGEIAFARKRCDSYGGTDLIFQWDPQGNGHFTCEGVDY